MASEIGQIFGQIVEIKAIIEEWFYDTKTDN